MANVKITNLPIAGAITGTEVVPVVQSGGTKQATVSAITAAATAAAASKVAGVTASAPLASTGGTAPNISLTGQVPPGNGGTGLSATPTNGQIPIGNGSGYALATLTPGTGITITNGPGSVSISAAGLPVMNVVSGTSQNAVAGNHYVITNVAATTVTLPATPAAGDVVWVTVANSLTTNVIARNGQNIMGLAEDMTLNATYAAVQLRFVNASLGWRLV